MTLITPRRTDAVRVLPSSSLVDIDLDYIFQPDPVAETVLAEPETVSYEPGLVCSDVYDYRVPVNVDPVTDRVSVSDVWQTAVQRPVTPIATETVSWCSTEPLLTDVETEAYETSYTSPEVHFWHPHFTRVLRSATEENRLTVAYIYIEDTGETAFGVSFCSHNDQFSRPLGREIAETRLEEQPVFLDLQRGLGLSQVREAIVDILSGGVRHVFVPGLPHGKITVTRA